MTPAREGRSAGSVASTFDGTGVTFDDRGAGSPALLFIHGLAGDRSDFVHQVERFFPTHRVVTVDLPGSGASSGTRATWTMAAFGEDVASVADHLGLDDLVLIGHSLGGDVTVEAAVRLGDRVRGLIWVSSYRGLGSPMGEAQVEAWLTPFRTDFAAAAQHLARRNFGPRADPELVTRSATKLSSANPAMVVQLLRSKLLNEAALLRHLASIDAPIVAINPDFKANDAASLTEHGVDLMEVPGAGHYTMLEAPDAFNALLETAIASFSRRS